MRGRQRDELERESEDELFPERFVPGEMHGLIEVEHLARYRWAAGLLSGRSVLDAGCGVGYGSRLLVDCGAAPVVGVDIAPEAIDAARAHAGSDGQLEFILGDLRSLPIADGSVEAVVCFEAIEHVREQDAVLDELRRVLAPQGLVVISSPNRGVYEAGNPHHTREYTPEEMRAALAERFANVALARQQAWLASMICDEQALSEDDPARDLGVHVGKVAALDPERVTFTLALASDAPLPSASSLAMLTSVEELSNWIARARSAEDHLALAQRDVSAAEAGHRSADAAYSSARAAYESAQAAYESATHAHAALERSYRDALADLEHSRGEAAAGAEQLHRTKTMLAERNATLRMATDELRAAQAREHELRAALDASALALGELRSSLLWRLGMPLRRLGRGRRAG